MISVFTPTHDPRFLVEAYESLLAQTHSEWEWVIVLNGGATLPVELSDDRVHPILAPDGLAGVGALKKFATSCCRGDILVELDHDDILAPTCLKEIQSAVDGGADFVYSDFANFYHDGKCQIYGRAYGWENYKSTVCGKDVTAMRSFAPDAGSLSAIFFAPNHVRAWTVAAYIKAGGYDPKLAICDDYDLVCRTYLSGATFHHIPRCLYLYRMRQDGGNTFLKRNAEIQTKQQEVANRYFYQLVNEWCRREGLEKIDLGGGIGKPDGYTSIDLRGGDIVADIRRGIPLADNSVGVVRAYDFLEHINPGAVVHVMNEIYRVLVPGGWLLSMTPSTDGRGAFQDPTHVSFWNPNSFWYYTRREQQRFVPEISARFQGRRVFQAYPSKWHEEHRILYVYADLCALKGQRQSGLCEI